MKVQFNKELSALIRVCLRYNTIDTDIKTLQIHCFIYIEIPIICLFLIDDSLFTLWSSLAVCIPVR